MKHNKRRRRKKSSLKVSRPLTRTLSLSISLLTWVLPFSAIPDPYEGSTEIFVQWKNCAGISMNKEWLLDRGDSIKMSESFSGLISATAKSSGCVSLLFVNHLTCSRPVFSQLWSATGVQDTGLKELSLNELPASLSVHALTLLQQSAI